MSLGSHRTHREHRRTGHCYFVSYTVLIVRRDIVILTIIRSNSLTGLPDYEKCELLSCLGRLSCAMTGSFSKRTSVGLSEDILLCYVCDRKDPRTRASSFPQVDDFESLWKVFANILPRLPRVPMVRITAVTALRRTLVHAPTSSQMHLASSSFGEFCLHSLRSSVREVRIATGYDKSLD